MTESNPGSEPPTGTSNAARVRDFHAAVGAPVPAHPAIPSGTTMALRKTLITEEYREVCEAIDQIEAARDRGEDPELDALARLAQELADLLYVVYGGFSDCGIDGDAVFAEVHRANMRKASGPRRADGKALKPPDWTPPNVSRLIRRPETRTDSD